MDTQAFDIVAIAGATLGLICVSIYSFRRIAGINRQKFEHFKRATSLRKPLTNKPEYQQFAETH